jgi:hypothetical protein
MDIYIYVYIYIYINLCLHIHMYIFVYMCMCIYMLPRFHPTLFMANANKQFCSARFGFLRNPGHPGIHKALTPSDFVDDL